MKTFPVGVEVARLKSKNETSYVVSYNKGKL
jgi:hypothetical protein